MGQLKPDDLPIRDELRGSTEYGAPQLSVAYQLNTNENPYPPSEAIINDIARQVEKIGADLNRYPDRDAVELRTALAEYFSNQTSVPVEVSQVWAANGSNEVLQQLLQVFGGPGRKAMGFTPSYSMHPILCAGTQTEFVGIPRQESDNFEINIEQAIEAISEQCPDIVFITTPNNPTGNVTSVDDIRRILDAAPGIVIVDEAYAEFSAEQSAATLLKDYPKSLVVSRTMSKAFDFAGGRLGYFVADPAFIKAVMLVRLPYHLSALSQVAARVALSHSQETLSTVETLARQRDRVVAQLRQWDIRVIDSQSNFIFFSVEGAVAAGDAHATWQAYLDRDVLIRDVGVPGWLRATIGLPEENDAFLAATKEIFEP